MCDFGISGYLVDSVAKTIDAGCKPYMAVSRQSFFSFWLGTFYSSLKGNILQVRPDLKV